MLRSSLIALFLFCFLLAKSQFIIGKITDAETGESVPFANVFYAGSLNGTTSDIDGNFRLESLSEGVYDLVVSYVGYDTWTQELDFDSQKSFELDIKLKPKTIDLPEIFVNADTANWANNYEVFKENFLGTNKNASKCEILNPKSIYFYYDPQENFFAAHCKEPIYIVNEALGYKVTYLLERFEIDFRSGKSVSYGVPRFEYLTSGKKSKNRKWSYARKEAYNGSVMHLFRSIYKRNYWDQGFGLYEFERIPNPKRPSDEFLNRKIKGLRSRLLAAGEIRLDTKNPIQDSLSMYISLRNQPKYNDKLGKKIENPKDLFDPSKSDKILYEGMLFAIYAREKEEIGYLRKIRRFGLSPKEQKSIIHVFSEDVQLFRNGHYRKLEDVFFEGYFAWSEKISNLLPLEYNPEEEI